MFTFARPKLSSPSGARGYRAYAIGDIHGRLDLLDRLLADVHRDMADRAPLKTFLIFLGDLIDRGPSSAEVVERLRTYNHPGVRPVFLLGNHEEVLLRILGGETTLIAKWRWFGGNECLKSYGVDPASIAKLDDKAALAAIQRGIPPQHVEFLRRFADTFRFCDYLFVHAGIRPGIELDRQQQTDMRWIREPFLNNSSDHGFIVVHGHTIERQVSERPNRIGIDTGAFDTGVLTAIAIEGTQRWYLSTAGAGPAVSSPR